MKYNEFLVQKLLDKSEEAFMMAIEIYNKPSIRYRVEGFSFFICNAWELMLKAHLVKTKGESSIYYRDNPDRTITLENCIKLIDTNENSPVRKNLLRIVELRNTSTHFIVEEYEMVYIPLFQACIFNFSEKMMEYHGVDLTQLIPQNFLTLSVSMAALSAAEIRAKYPGQIAEKLLSTKDTIDLESNAANSAFAIRIEQYHYITKDRSKASDVLHISKDGEAGVQILREVKDVNNVYGYNAKKLIKEVNTRLNRLGIKLLYNGEIKEFNTFHLNLFTKYYGIKNDPVMCHSSTLHKAPTYGYSVRAIDFIVEEIKKDPEHIVQNLKTQLAKRKS